MLLLSNIFLTLSLSISKPKSMERKVASQSCILDVQVASFANPVIGEEQDIKVELPKGFIWKIASMAKTKVMRIMTLNLNFDDSGKNARYSVVEYKGPWGRVICLDCNIIIMSNKAFVKAAIEESKRDLLFILSCFAPLVP